MFGTRCRARTNKQQRNKDRKRVKNIVDELEMEEDEWKETQESSCQHVTKSV